MSTKLIAVSQPRVEGLTTAEDLTTFIARVSNPTNQLNVGTGHKLINYCLEHQHVSIFEHAFVTIEMTTSRAIAAQILRHRSFSFQEFSQRYAQVFSTTEKYAARKQADKNRQSSVEPCDEADADWFEAAQEEVEVIASRLYRGALNRGIAREQARMLLPLSATTRLYMSGSLRSWIHYVQLRTKEDTQYEHQVLARKCREILAQEFPTVAAALDWPTAPAVERGAAVPGRTDADQ